MYEGYVHVVVGTLNMYVYTLGYVRYVMFCMYVGCVCPYVYYVCMYVWYVWMICAVCCVMYVRKMLCMYNMLCNVMYVGCV